MSKPLNGRLAELELIAARGPVAIVYADTGWLPPNRFISNAIIHDFIDRNLIERKENLAVVTEKGIKVLKERG